MEHTIYFQQDECPPHNAQIVREYLNSMFGERWIGTLDQFFDPHSPDLYPLNFFLWGHLQSIIYAVLIQNVEHLKQRIRIACTKIRHESIPEALNTNLLRKVELCIQ